MITNHEIYERAIELLESYRLDNICGALYCACSAEEYSKRETLRAFVKDEFLSWFLPEEESPDEPFFGSWHSLENRSARILALHFLIHITELKVLP